MTAARVATGLRAIAPAPPPATAAPPPGGGSFAEALETAARDGRATALREAAEQLVSSALLQPLFASMRESSLAAGPFAPGAAERHFRPLLDRHLADAVTGAARFTLVDDVVARYGGAGEARRG